MSERTVDWLHQPNREEMKAAYMVLAKFADFKVGDKVKVARDWENHELGCSSINIPLVVGNIGTIVEDTRSEDGTVRVIFRNGCYYIPFHVLELVEPVSEKVKVTVEKNGTSKEMEFTKEEWKKIETTVGE